MDRLVHVDEEGIVAPGPRERLIDSAIVMMRERGVHATGLADLLKRSGTARNSIYQHFPAGKAQLIVAAEHEATGLATGFLEALRARGDAEYVLSKFIKWWVNQLETHDFDTGCPHAAAALAGPGEAGIRAAASEAFLALRGQLAAAFRDSGVTEGVDSLASLAVSAIEGALLQAQASHSVQPLRDIECELRALIRSRRQ
ncbi:TetR family transcriptional regulator [Mycobacterium sp. CBMA271]|uniref:TetR/AcrR family transcriptional regulator n=1 Tax=unclassified Mycobacteroides TaxID=2618759 RepID=UPI0012DCBAE7|nr:MULTISPECIES: TetR/AcrR family transcriptional regulator [unclassified Mycobacteroides]MUM18337.1 TetR family transcriptional regulator [Mycobacteroides sp. CBMA 326]MUM20031.1 TetR family transcriptional regulator [Mycobacteroides sp. CBMA 326]MUM20921.1 TetR family transcriptional regulator [Mycobacteroides sp. CBMA 271]